MFTCIATFNLYTSSLYILKLMRTFMYTLIQWMDKETFVYKILYNAM